MSTWSAADEVALRGLADRYALAADRRDVDGFLSVFAADATLTVRTADDEAVRSTFHGHDELAEIPRLLERFTRTFHLVGTVHHRPDDDGAIGQVYCDAHHVSGPADRPVDLVQHIRYDDRCRRGDDGRWVISERRVEVLFAHRADTVPAFGPPRG